MANAKELLKLVLKRGFHERSHIPINTAWRHFLEKEMVEWGVQDYDLYGKTQDEIRRITAQSFTA